MTRAHAEGFSLVETLVALAVIAASSGLLFETISTSVSLSRTLMARREAVLLAQSLLASAAAPGDAPAVAPEGAAQGLAWRITRMRQGGGARDGDVAVEDVRVEVRDRATGHRLTSVHTLRLAR
jgi:prepilin-type N-terminal cleavage/methylation domain-containing protein